jgi:hypothetical protein
LLLLFQFTELEHQEVFQDYAQMKDGKRVFVRPVILIYHKGELKSLTRGYEKEKVVLGEMIDKIQKGITLETHPADLKPSGDHAAPRTFMDMMMRRDPQARKASQSNSTHPAARTSSN